MNFMDAIKPKALKADRRKPSAQKYLSVGWSIFRGALIIALAYILMYPMLYMFSMSFRHIEDMYDVTVRWLPKHYTMDNLSRVFSAIDYPKAFFNTLLLSAVCSLASVAVCSLSGYGLARFKFKGSNALFALMLFTIVVPQQFFIMPTYLNFAEIGIVDSYWAIILPAVFGAGIRSGLYVYIFRQFFKGMPRELEEASYIDGCGYVKTFLRIMLPSSISAFVTCFLFSFVWNWNDYQITGMLLNRNNHPTLSSSLVMLAKIMQGIDAGDSGVFVPDANRTMLDMQAGALLVVAPVIIVYFIFHRFFIESIERTGLVE